MKKEDEFAKSKSWMVWTGNYFGKRKRRYLKVSWHRDRSAQKMQHNLKRSKKLGNNNKGLFGKTGNGSMF